jgi:molecular chaperone DnaJ
VAPQREWFEKDYYKVLGVDPKATEKEISRAYRKLAKQYHPDANPGDVAAEERFKEVSAANEVLGDPEKRKEYDQVREMVASGVGPGGFGGFPGGGFPGGGFGGAGGQTFTFDDVGLGDILGGLFGSQAGGAGRSRRGRRSQTQGPTAGADLHAELYLDFMDAVHGVTTTVHLTGEAVCSVCQGSGAKPGTTPEVCPTCNGAGDVIVDQGPFSFSQVCPQCGGRGAIVKDKCRNCKGRGVEVRPREVKVKIPAGVQAGQRIKVAGRGAPGRYGGPPGDLYVVVHVHHHPVFGRSGKANLTVKVPITFAEAALGAAVKVPTLDAPVTVKVKPGTQSGTTVKVPKRGIVLPDGTIGDLLVTFVVQVPTHPTDEQRAAIEALAATMPENPRVDLGV